MADADNYGIAILADSSISADQRSDILRTVLQVLTPYTVATVPGTWAGNADSKNETVIEIGGTTEAWGIRIIMAEATFGYVKTYQVVRAIMTTIESEIAGATHLILTHIAAYVTGTQVYDYTITLT